MQLWFGCSFGSYSCRALGLQDGPCSGPAAPLLLQMKFDTAPCGTWQPLELWECFANLPAGQESFSWNNGTGRNGIPASEVCLKGFAASGKCRFPVVFPTDPRNCAP